MDIAVTTRPVRPDDQARFYRLWPRLSAETVYRRFHAPVHSLPAETVRRLVTVDHDLREAVVAVVGGEVVGVARYDRPVDDPATAEIAVLVEDAWQGVGLGRQLLAELSSLAARRGVRTLTATVQPGNRPALGLARRLLPRATVVPDDDVLTVTGPLAPPEPVSAPPRAGSLVLTAPH
ncbi:GNAT family N-acetyltransferase [Blastococcus haudaquaticus]|uniref:Acetyltransferase (GNAT) family protein n=1 Tax=Blastococcus haudaquaticus TaxID=1938745 RepID=A0A286GRS6_9ACTN|nr:GNAT family N-acetyltransferase [Blastococcus haudaquaticus]SOD98230.1 Acetyltransferase (GNAT) family protein [Blastococcus haudaquaticus]